MAERNELIGWIESDESSRERSVDEIRHDIAARRENITETVDKLSEQVQRKLDWREYVVDHPFAALGLAAGAGMVVAGIFKQRATPAERIMCALSDSVEEITGRVRNQLDFLPEKSSGVKGTAMVAATTMIAKALTNYLGSGVSETVNSRHRTNQQDETQYYNDQGYAGGTSAEKFKTTY